MLIWGSINKSVILKWRTGFSKIERSILNVTVLDYHKLRLKVLLFLDPSKYLIEVLIQDHYYSVVPFLSAESFFQVWGKEIFTGSKFGGYGGWKNNS